MSEQEPLVERNVRAMLAERAGDVRIPADLAGAVIDRRRRRSRVTLVASAAAVAIVAAGVPLALRATGAQAPRPTPTSSAARPAPACPRALPPANSAAAVAGTNQLPEQRNVRGSLGGDRAVVRQVLVAGWVGLVRSERDLAKLSHEAPHVFDPATARVEFVHQVGGDALALVAAVDPHRKWAASAWVTRVAGGRWTASGGEGYALTPGDFDRRLGQLFYGDDPLYLYMVSLNCARLAIVLAPPGSLAEIAAGADVTADGHVVRSYRPVALRDGFAAVPVDATTSAAHVQVLQGGRVVAQRVVSDGGGVQARNWPSADGLATAIKNGRGRVDPSLATQAIGLMPYWLQAFHLGRPEVIWGGTLPDGKPVVLVANVFASGARFVAEIHGLRGGFGGGFDGVLPAGTLDRRVLTWRVGSAVVVVATRGVRAEAVLANGTTVPVPFSDGGGVLAAGKQLKSVRVYDAGGALIEERKPDTGLLDLPGRM